MTVPTGWENSNFLRVARRTATLIAASILIAALTGASRSPADPPAPGTAALPTLYIIGDSTVNNHGNGLLGWGDPIADLFDKSKIQVVNRARGGRSSRSFRTEGLWEQVRSKLKPGDFVLVQFGHNDGGSLTTNRNRASLKGMGDETQQSIESEAGKPETVHTFGWYMRRYAAEAKAQGATAILLSPVPRNIWKPDNTVARAAGDYGTWAKEAAAAEYALFIDLNELVAQRYEKIGPDKVKAAYFPGDHTHTNAEGARVNAECVVEGIRVVKKCALAGFLQGS